jgi:uncharacterized protein with von Willebrand factor type A (vWA) domain
VRRAPTGSLADVVVAAVADARLADAAGVGRAAEDARVDRAGLGLGVRRRQRADGKPRFGDRAEAVDLADIPYIEAGPYHTNTREALQLGRSLLARRKQPNKQIFLITDGKPSAITEGGHVYKNPFGLDMKIVNLTLEEADLCRRQRIVITTFMIATDPLLTNFVEKLTQVNRGRAYFASPYNLGEFILADYIRNRRKRVR